MTIQTLTLFSILHRRVFIVYLIAFSVGMVSLNLPALSGERLPINVVLPYSVQNSTFKFGITYAWQMVGTSAVVHGHLVADNLFVSFLLLIRRQQEILKYRLQNITVSCNSNLSGARSIMVHNQLIKQCIKDHELIYR